MKKERVELKEDKRIIPTCAITAITTRRPAVTGFSLELLIGSLGFVDCSASIPFFDICFATSSGFVKLTPRISCDLSTSEESLRNTSEVTETGSSEVDCVLVDALLLLDEVLEEDGLEELELDEAISIVIS